MKAFTRAAAIAAAGVFGAMFAGCTSTPKGPELPSSGEIVVTAKAKDGTETTTVTRTAHAVNVAAWQEAQGAKPACEFEAIPGQSITISGAKRFVCYSSAGSSGSGAMPQPAVERSGAETMILAVDRIAERAMQGLGIWSNFRAARFASEVSRDIALSRDRSTVDLVNVQGRNSVDLALALKPGPAAAPTPTTAITIDGNGNVNLGGTLSLTTTTTTTTNSGNRQCSSAPGGGTTTGAGGPGGAATC